MEDVKSKVKKDIMQWIKKENMGIGDSLFFPALNGCVFVKLNSTERDFAAKILEEFVTDSLFDRKGNSLILTEAGYKLFNL